MRATRLEPSAVKRQCSVRVCQQTHADGDDLELTLEEGQEIRGRHEGIILDLTSLLSRFKPPLTTDLDQLTAHGLIDKYFGDIVCRANSKGDQKSGTSLPLGN